MDFFNFCWVFQKFPFFCVTLYIILTTFFFKCNPTQYTRPLRNVSNNFEYLENRCHDLDVTRQRVRGDLTAHPRRVTLPWGQSIGSETPLTEIVYCVTVAFTMTERADQRIRFKAPAHSTVLVQAFFWQNIASSRYVSTPTAQIWLPATSGCSQS